MNGGLFMLIMKPTPQVEQAFILMVKFKKTIQEQVLLLVLVIMFKLAVVPGSDTTIEYLKAILLKLLSCLKKHQI